MAKIAGQVALIVNEREVAINVGESDGVREGMIFRILEKARDIIDPKDSKTVLGTLQREKIRVKIVKVDPRFSIARTFETYQVERRGLGTVREFFGGLSSGGGVETRVRTLRATDDLAPGPLNPENSFVKIGDLVESVDEEK